jgi:predicted lipoprotein
VNRRTAACSTLWAALAAVIFCAPLQGLAQGTAPVPFYQPEDATAGLYRTHTGPLARTFAERAPGLVQALQKHCEGPANLPAARTAWTNTMLAWEGLAAVAVGPLVERRSLRSIDFQPLRPELLQRMLARSPRTLDDMVRVGTPAKGLPAIEHLLWVAPVAPGTPACTYAVLAAQEVQREALALNEAFNTLAAQPPQGEAAGVAFGEFVNQWLGGLERLRWAGLEKPLREATTRQAPPSFARMPSGQTGAAWRAHWAALRAMAIQVDGAAPPPPGEAAVPIETYLRGRGQLALAEQWRQGVLQADAALQAATPANGVLDPTRIEAATSALKGVTLLMQAQVAPALEVSIGFSSADGD